MILCFCYCYKLQYGSYELKQLELQKAELIRNYNLERYIQLKELYSDHPTNKYLKEAELNYHYSEIEVAIKNLP